MKVKIVAVPTKRTCPLIRFETVGPDPFFDRHCFGLCVAGILDAGPDWHAGTLSVSERRTIQEFQEKANDDNQYFFSGLEKDYLQTVVYQWKRPELLERFETVFNNNHNAGGYLLALKTQEHSGEGHVMVVKYREGSWRFMDPTVQEINKQHGYLHTALSEDGCFSAANGNTLSLRDYVFNRYPQINFIGVIHVQPKA